MYLCAYLNVLVVVVFQFMEKLRVCSSGVCLVATAFIAFLIVVFALIISGDFLPYVLDNNETYSSLLHAVNLLHDGVDITLGLTDEHLGGGAAGPLYYTHQGNFPRFFSAFLDILGLKSAESQIILTSTIIGGGGFLLGLHFFRANSNGILAGLAGLFLATDYVLSAQWQVAAWQVWRFFFLYAGLSVAQAVAKRPRVGYLLSGGILFACLAYYDPSYTVLVCTACVLFGMLCRPSPRAVMAILIMVGGGAAFGGAVLVLQCVMVFGWPVFLQDLQYTYMARNVLGNPSQLTSMENFFFSHKILFWPSFNGPVSVGRLHDAIVAPFRYCFSIYGPFFSTLVLLIGGATALTASDARAVHHGRGRPTAGVLMLAGWGSCGLAVVFRSNAGSVWLAVHIILLVMLMNDLIGRLATALQSGCPVPAGRLGLAAVWFGLVASSVFGQPYVYDSTLVPFWEELSRWIGGAGFSGVWLLLGAWISARLVLDGLGSHGPSVRPLGRLLVAGYAGFAAAMLLLPGYFIKTVLMRYVPTTVGVHVVLFALTLYGLGLMVGRNRGDWSWGAWRQWRGTVVPSALMAVVLLSWTSTQLTYARRLPADTFPFLSSLRAPPFAGSSFVVDNFAVPVGVMAGGWAYIDDYLWRNEVRLGPDGWHFHHDRRYLWFADRDSNSDYLRPHFFVCMIQRQITDVLPGGGSRSRCGDRDLVRIARSGGNALLSPREELRDPSGEDRWSIVSLDWNLPPFLPPGRIDASAVQASFLPDKRGRLVARIAHAAPVGGDVAGYRLYAVDSCDNDVHRRLLAEVGAADGLSLPGDAQGIFQIAVRLASTTSLSPEFFSPPLILGSARVPVGCNTVLPRRWFSVSRNREG